uniref:Ig-like domain-containing protein n=1 Tax=Oryzias sinensis TaxID=183150 RepID=A0A8C8E2M4_9TELE
MKSHSIMDQRWMKILLTLVFHLQVTTGADRTIQEGIPVYFKCQISEGTVVFWFRMLDGSNMEFIASFSNTGMEKKFEQQYKNLFSHEKKDTYFILTLKSFSAPRDSGAYVCAALVKGNTLQFGEIDRVHGGNFRVHNVVFKVFAKRNNHVLFLYREKAGNNKSPVDDLHPATNNCLHTCIHQELRLLTHAGCRCQDSSPFFYRRNTQTDRKYIYFYFFAEKTKPLLPCDPLILGSLAGGCGLLLLLLIIITLYCNRTFRNHNILHTLERFKQSYM